MEDRTLAPICRKYVLAFLFEGDFAYETQHGLEVK